jgi:hypothetical protein
MGTAGLFGYGTLGLTFAIYSDPGRSPWFSSGTINNVVYEIYESAILRTTSDVFVDGGVQIDNSGIFGVDPTTGGARMETEADNFLFTEDGRTLAVGGVSFMLDATTGNMWAENAFLSGTVYAQSGVFTGTVYASDGSFTGTVNASAGVFTGTVSASTITGGTVTGSRISGGTVSGGLVSGGTITGALVTAGTVSGGTVSGAVVTGGTVTVAGGSVRLDDQNGIRFDAGASYVVGAVNPHFIKWNVGTTNYSFIGGEGSGTISTLDFRAGDVSAITGLIRFNAYAASGSNYSNLDFRPGAILFLPQGATNGYDNPVLSGLFNIFQGSVTSFVDICPGYTNSTFLGGTTNAYKALFLSDGTDEWKITINSSGVLQTVKV